MNIVIDVLLLEHNMFRGVNMPSMTVIVVHFNFTKEKLLVLYKKHFTLIFSARSQCL